MLMLLIILVSVLFIILFVSRDRIQFTTSLIDQQRCLVLHNRCSGAVTRGCFQQQGMYGMYVMRMGVCMYACSHVCKHACMCFFCWGQRRAAVARHGFLPPASPHCAELNELRPGCRKMKSDASEHPFLKKKVFTPNLPFGHFINRDH
jgi:hypothetical protein